MFDGIAEAFHGGGIWMYPILACFLAAWAIFFERFFVLFIQTREDKTLLLRGLNNYVLKGDMQGAVRFLSSQKPGPLVRILKAGLLKIHRSDLEVQAALDEASLREVPHLEHRTGYLAVLSNAATLCGLLGTIIGMIHCFAAVANVDPAQKATILAAGIAEAMNCTAFGLIAAIPALLQFGWLQSRTQSLIDGINETVVAELNMVMANRRLFAGQDLPEGAGAEAK